MVTSKIVVASTAWFLAVKLGTICEVGYLFSLPKSVFRTSCVAALLTFFVDHNHKVQVLPAHGHITVIVSEFIIPMLNYPLHHMRNVMYQALLPLPLGERALDEANSG